MVLGDTFAVSGRVFIDDLSGKSIVASLGSELWICAMKNEGWEGEIANESFLPSSDNKEILVTRGSLWLCAHRSLSYDSCDMDLC